MTTGTSRMPSSARSRRLLAGVAPAVIAWVLCADARADVVGLSGRPPTIDVRIVGFRNGQIEYRLSAERQTSHPIEEIDYLQITNWPLFNLAEKQQRDGHVRQASSNYERLLKQLAEPSPGELDRRQLVRCRLLRVLDQQGRFDQAVEVYLDVIEQEPSLTERLRPTRLPASGSTFLQAALKSVNAAIRRHGDDETARSLARWRDSWRTAQSRPAAGTQAGPASQPAGPATADVARRVAEIRQSVDGGRMDEALGQVDALLKASPQAANADIFFWQGKALLGRADSGKTDDADRDRARAGLAFMRVVIHFPGHGLAPQCLFEAAEICRRSGRPEQAAALWSELVRDYPTAAEWVSRARQELEKNREWKVRN